MSDWLILIGVVVFFTVALIVWGKLCVRVEHEWEPGVQRTSPAPGGRLPPPPVPGGW